MADAIRDELRIELTEAHGDLKAAAVALGVPYKTLYRALTARGEDRSASVKLDLVVQIAEHLESVGRGGFNALYARAASRRSVDRGEGSYEAD